MKNKKIETEVMEKIQSNKIKMKPRWKYALKKSGIQGVWLMSILAASISLSMIVYFLGIYNPEILKDYGEVGEQLFFGDFPYLWLGGSIVLFFGGLVMFSRLGDNYKKPARIIVLMTSLAVAGATVAIILVRNLFRIGI